MKSRQTGASVPFSHGEAFDHCNLFIGNILERVLDKLLIFYIQTLMWFSHKLVIECVLCRTVKQLGRTLDTRVTGWPSLSHVRRPPLTDPSLSAQVCWPVSFLVFSCWEFLAPVLVLSLSAWQPFSLKSQSSCRLSLKLLLSLSPHPVRVCLWQFVILRVFFLLGICDSTHLENLSSPPDYDFQSQSLVVCHIFFRPLRWQTHFLSVTLFLFLPLRSFLQVTTLGEHACQPPPLTVSLFTAS